jgi:FkbM family methyltransferase
MVLPKYFPPGFLKNRYLNKGYRLLSVLHQALLRTRSPRPAFPLERLGSRYGGWFVPTTLMTSDWVVYSGGLLEDISFDEQVISRFGCRVYGFDPTPEAIAHVARRRHVSAALGNFVHVPVGLWKENATLKFYAPRTRGWVGSYSVHNLQGMGGYFEAPCRTITALMAELGHHKLDLLKIDIEGSEYEVLDHMLTHGVRVDWLCVEFDQPVPFWTTAAMLHRLSDSGFVLQKVDHWNLTFAHRTVWGR